MIKTESFFVGEKEFVRTYSDRNMMIHGGVPEGDYTEATDPAELGRTYMETDIPIEEDDSTEADKAEAFDILLGGAS